MWSLARSDQRKITFQSVLLSFSIIFLIAAHSVGEHYRQMHMPLVEGAARPADIQVGSQNSQRRIPAERVLITLRRSGFDPTELTHHAGLILLAVDNRSGQEDVLLRLDRVSGERLHEERMGHGRLDWRKPFELRPGNYLLTEANHPTWVCHINITPQ
jgi:hypothetical protein